MIEWLKNFVRFEPIRLAYFILIGAQALYAGLDQGLTGPGLANFVIGALVTVLAGEIARHEYTPYTKREAELTTIEASVESQQSLDSETPVG